MVFRNLGLRDGISYFSVAFTFLYSFYRRLDGTSPVFRNHGKTQTEESSLSYPESSLKKVLKNENPELYFGLMKECNVLIDGT